MSRVLVVVQARMGSTRLPGKVLMDVAGRPLLAFMLDRLAPLAAQGATVVVATSALDRDQPVADLAAEVGVPAVRGDEADVLARFGRALDEHPADLVVRLTADCPLIDAGVVAQVIDRARTSGADYTSNTLVRTYPDGLDVEVLTADAVRAAVADATDPTEREHVTPHVYRRPRTFGIAQVTSGEDAGDERWTVDRAEDLDIVREAVAGLPDPTAGTWLDLLRRLGRRAPRAPGAVRAVPGPDVAHRPGLPYERRWAITRDDEALGRAVVTVDDGVGTLRLDLADPAAAADDAARAVQTWLAADLQTTTLDHHPEGTTDGPPH